MLKQLYLKKGKGREQNMNFSPKDNATKRKSQRKKSEIPEKNYPKLRDKKKENTTSNNKNKRRRGIFIEKGHRIQPGKKMKKF